MHVFCCFRFFQGKVASYAVPDDVVFVAEIPHNATGRLAGRPTGLPVEGVRCAVVYRTRPGDSEGF